LASIVLGDIRKSLNFDLNLTDQINIWDPLYKTRLQL